MDKDTKELREPKYKVGDVLRSRNECSSIRIVASTPFQEATHYIVLVENLNMPIGLFEFSISKHYELKPYCRTPLYQILIGLD